MNPKVIMSKFRRGFAWQAPFINAVQTRIANLTKDEPKDQQYKLILAPADEQPAEKTPAQALVEYWEAALSQEELADIAERMKAIPPEQMKEMFKEWWAVSAKQYLADNGLEELT